MYEQVFHYMGLREDPFHVSPDPRFFYCTPAHETALTELLFGIETRQGLMVLTGEPGTGKTSVLKQILDWLQRRGRSSSFIFHTRVEPIGLLRLMVSDFGIACQSRSKSELVKALHHWLLQRHAAGDLPVLVLDEAQALPPQTLDELRLMLNLETPRGKLLQVILSGQPELEEKLRLPSLRQLRQRVMFHSRLPELTERETAAYISRRLEVAGCSDSTLFPEKVVQDIYTSSHGIPRVVNLLCEHALISAYGEQRRAVSPEMIQRIAADFELCAKPITATDWELRRRYPRMPAFPEMEDVASGPASAPTMPAEAAPAVEKIEPIADVAPAAPIAAAPAPTVAPSAAAQLQKPMKYWRRYRSRSAVVVFAGNCVGYMQRAWREFRRELVEYARTLSRAVFPTRGKGRLPSVAAWRSTANWWTQIEFDVYKDVVPRRTYAGRIPVTVEEDPLASEAPSVVAQSVRSGKRWWNNRWRSSAAALAGKSGEFLERVSRAVSDPIVDYARSVVDSFVRDCRTMFRVPTWSTPVSGLGSPVDSNDEKSARRRNAVAVVHWLRQPMSPRNGFRNGAAARVPMARSKVKAGAR